MPYNVMQHRLNHCCAMHWCIPNLFSGAKEKVCGCSPIACVLIECRVQYGGKWEQQQQRTNLDQLRIQHRCQSWVKLMEYCCSSQFPLYTYRDLPLYEVHQIGRANPRLRALPLNYLCMEWVFS